MKSGTYVVSFTVEINNCRGQKQAQESVLKSLNILADDNDLPEFNFELVEDLDEDYHMNDGGYLEELNF